MLIADPDKVEALDWSVPQHITLVTVEGDATDGAAHFHADQRYGLAAYGLDYEDGEDHTWSLTRGLNGDGAAALSDTAYAAQNLFTVSTQLVTERVDDLRDIFLAGAAPAGAPMAYDAVVGQSPAFAALDAKQGARSGFLWAKGGALTSSGDGYDMDTGVFQGGVDMAGEIGGNLFAMGLIGGYGRSSLDFDLPATHATVDGPVYGVYGAYFAGNGVFVNGTLLGQTFDVDMRLSSVDSAFSGSTFGGRAEAGIRLDRGGVAVEPAIALRASHTSFDTVDVGAVAAGFEDTSTLATEARLRLAGSFRKETVVLKPYATLMVGYEFLADNTVVIPSLDSSYTGGDDGLYGDVGLGLTVSDATGAYAGFVQGNVGFSEDRTSAGIKVGGQVRF